jgi:hypothetical protein
VSTHQSRNELKCDPKVWRMHHWFSLINYNGSSSSRQKYDIRTKIIILKEPSTLRLQFIILDHFHNKIHAMRNIVNRVSTFGQIDRLGFLCTTVAAAPPRHGFNPLRREVYFCHQNQNAKNIGNFTTRLKPHNIGTHLKGIETSFQVVTLLLESFHFWMSYWNFLKYLQSLKG